MYCFLIASLPELSLEMPAPMTVQEFVNLTKDSFGSSVIRQLAEKLGIELDERR